MQRNHTKPIPEDSEVKEPLKEMRISINPRAICVGNYYSYDKTVRCPHIADIFVSSLELESVVFEFDKNCDLDKYHINASESANKNVCQLRIAISHDKSQFTAHITLKDKTKILATAIIRSNKDLSYYEIPSPENNKEYHGRDYEEPQASSRYTFS